MKKLLSFLVAGIAALGLASCSGDLHNEIDPSSDFAKYVLGAGINVDDFETFELCGSMTGWANTADTNIKFVANEDGTYEADFQADAADVEFAFITKTGKWNEYQIGGESMKAGTLPDGIEFSSVAGGGKHENGKFSGLTAKKFYKMTVDISTGEYVVSITSTNPQPLYLAGYFIANSQDNGDITTSNVLKNPKLDKSNYYVTYTYNFTYDASKASNWGLNDDEFGFNIVLDSEKYTKANFAVGTDTKYVETTLVTGGMDKNLVTGLEDGTLYAITIQTTPEKVVSYKVEKVLPYNCTLKFQVKGLNEGQHAWINGSFWGSTWPQGWAQTSWNTPKRAGFDEAVADSDGVAKFADNWNVDVTVIAGTTVSYSFKAQVCKVGGSWSTDTDCSSPANDLDLDFAPSEAGTYVVTVDVSNNWEVSCAKE